MAAAAWLAGGMARWETGGGDNGVVVARREAIVLALAVTCRSNMTSPLRLASTEGSARSPTWSRPRHLHARPVLAPTILAPLSPSRQDRPHTLPLPEWPTSSMGQPTMVMSEVGDKRCR